MQRAIFQQRFQVLFLKTIVKTVTDAKSLETISREAGALLARGEVVGFPTETQQEADELEQFIRQIKFDRLGCFPFSREEDPKA